MSKTTIKKLLQSMTKAEIIEMVLELYSARKEAKEYLEYYACPDEKEKLEEYKSIICEEFYPKKRRVLKTEDIHPPKTGISVHFSGSLV